MKSLKTKVFNVLMTLMVALLAFTSLPALPAFAATVGPIDPRSVAPGSTAALSGYPAWYRDDNGVAIELFPVNLVDNLISPPTPGSAYEAKLGFNTAFYWNCTDDGTVTFPNGGTVRVVFGYEAIASLGGTITPGDEAVFSRIRFSLKPGVPGTYTIQHPWGQDTVTVTAVDVANNRNVQFSDDVGVVPRVFTAAITPPAARETTFLKSLSAPPGKLGDGVTAGPVTGGKLRNSVIVTGPAGTMTITNFIVAGRLFAGVAPVASFTATPVTGAAPLTVNFADTSIGPAASWLWNFGDGTAAAPSTSTLANPTHIYTTAGTFTVTETVNNAVGPASTITKLVTVTAAVSAIPVASFVLTPTTGAAPLAVSFTDTSTGAPTAWSWNFGDGTPAVTAQNPTHTFNIAPTAPPTNFTVTELVSNALGTAATSKIITVTPPVPAIPVASFTPTPSVGAPPLAVKFTDTTTGVPTSWSWNFGDGGTSTLQNPTHTFAAAGIFPVTETVTNALGTDVATQVITVASLPGAPTNLAAAATTSTSVALTWTDNALNETLYMIQRATDAAFTLGMVELHTPANSTNFTDITATAGTKFFYRVIAGGAAGNSAPSNVVTLTTPGVGAPPAPPPAPAPAPNPAPAPAPAPPPVIAPSPAPPAGGGGGGGGGAPAPAPQPQPVALTGLLTATGLITDSLGHVQSDAQVKTSNDEVVLNIPAGTAIVDRNNARVASLTQAVATAPPAAPAGETVVSAVNMGPDGTQFSPAVGITLKIDPAKLPANTPLTKLYMAYHDGANWAKMDATLDETAKTLSAQIGHFTNFAIIAQATAAPTPPPAPPTSADAIVTPSAPGGLTANVDESGAVSLHWAVTSPNENGFMIERALDKDFSSGEAEFHVAAGTTSFTDITVIPGKTFFYRVLAVTGVGHSGPSNVVSVSVKAPEPVTPPAPATPTTPPASTTPPTPTAPVTPATPSTNWGLIAGIVVAAIVVAVLVIAMTRKKPAA